MLKTAEFPTKFIVSPAKAKQALFNPPTNSVDVPPSVLLREQEEKQASNKGSRKRTDTRLPGCPGENRTQATAATPN